MSYLKFSVGGQEFILHMRCIVEIIPYIIPIRESVNSSGPHGFFNVRGEVLPFLDFALLYAGFRSHIHQNTGIAILKNRIAEEKPEKIGLIVESMMEIYEVDEKILLKIPVFEISPGKNSAPSHDLIYRIEEDFLFDRCSRCERNVS